MTFCRYTLVVSTSKSALNKNFLINIIVGRNYVAHICDDLWLPDLTNFLLSEEISVDEQLILVRDLMFVDDID